MPESFKVVCVPYRALYKCSALLFYLRHCAVFGLYHHIKQPRPQPSKLHYLRKSMNAVETVLCDAYTSTTTATTENALVICCSEGVGEFRNR